MCALPLASQSRGPAIGRHCRDARKRHGSLLHACMTSQLRSSQLLVLEDVPRIHAVQVPTKSLRHAISWASHYGLDVLARASQLSTLSVW